jgi:hypothetical protein
MAERCHVNVKITERLDKAAGKRNLLFGLAQCGGRGAFVTAVDFATGK